MARLLLKIIIIIIIIIIINLGLYSPLTTLIYQQTDGFTLLSSYRGERSSSQFRGNMWSAYRFSQSE